MAWSLADALGSLRTVAEAGLGAYAGYQGTRLGLERSRLQSELTRAQIEAVNTETAAIRSLPATTTAGTGAAAPAPVVVASSGTPSEVTTAIGSLIQNQAAIAAELQSVGAARTTNADRARVARLTGERQAEDAQRLMLFAAFGMGLVLLSLKR